MANIYDVARLAKVSHTTVSAVLNERHGKYTPETRRRVLDAIAALGYKPSRTATQLATGRFDTIALCFGYTRAVDFRNWVLGPIIAGLGNSAGAAGFLTLFVPPTVGRTLADTIATFPTLDIGGAVIVGPIAKDQASFEAIDACEVPLVCIDSYTGLSKASTVDADNVGGMKSAVQHLISLGHHHIAYLSPTHPIKAFEDRLLGYREALRDNGIAPNDHVMTWLPDKDVYALVRKWLTSTTRPTAIVCASGSIGSRAVQAVSDLGMWVPNDVSLLVFDELLPLITPPWPISQAIIRTYDMGEAAMGAMVKLIRGEIASPVHVRIMPELILNP